MLSYEILTNPCNQMIFECSLDHLVEDVARKELMDIGTREIICKWLVNHV